MAFTQEELDSMAAWDAQVMQGDLTEDELDASDALDALAHAEQRIINSYNPQPQHKGNSRKKEMSYEDTVEREKEAKRRQHEYYLKRKAEGTLPKYNPEIHAKCYKKNRQKRLDYQRKQHQKDQYRRTHPHPEDVNAYCGECGLPLFVKAYQIKNSKTGKFFCSYTCKGAYFKRMNIERWKAEHPEEANAKPEPQPENIVVTYSLYKHMQSV